MHILEWIETVRYCPWHGQHHSPCQTRARQSSLPNFRQTHSVSGGCSACSRCSAWKSE